MNLLLYVNDGPIRPKIFVLSMDKTLSTWTVLREITFSRGEQLHIYWYDRAHRRLNRELANNSSKVKEYCD